MSQVIKNINYVFKALHVDELFNVTQYQTIMILNVDHGLFIEVAEKSTAKLLVHVWAKTFALSLEVINL